MNNRDRNQDQGGRTDRQPGSGNDGDMGNPDPRRTREQEERSRDPSQNRPNQRPGQAPKQ
jgi:hypothetical protein